MAGKVGRPTKWVTWQKKAKLEQVSEWFALGLTDKQVANNIGIGLATFYDWKVRYPQFTEAVKKGKDYIVYEVENALAKSAIGYDTEETVTDISIAKDGTKVQHIKKVKKHVAPNATSAIFFLKNKRPEEYRDRVETAISGSIETANRPLEKISDEQLEKIAGQLEDNG